MIRNLGPDQLLFGFWPVTEGDISIDSNYISKGSETAVYGELGFNFSEQTNLTVGYRSSTDECTFFRLYYAKLFNPLIR